MELIQFEIDSGPSKRTEVKRNGFSEEQIIGILKEHEAGVPVADLCRTHGVSSASIYKWKAKYGGMDVSEAKRLKSLEDENTKLKKLLADATAIALALRSGCLFAGIRATVGMAHESSCIAHGWKANGEDSADALR